MKKVGKTTRPFRYDLNPIPYDYTVEVKNGYMGLDLTDRVPEELRTEVCGIVLEMVIKIIPKKKKCQKRQNGCLRRPCKQLRKIEAKGKGEKVSYIYLNSELQGIARKVRKPSSVNNAKK